MIGKTATAPDVTGKNGMEMYKLISRLYPLCRSITGNGVRQTLEIIGEIIPLQITEVPSGTRVFDWEIPREWNIRDAYIKNERGRKIVDFRNSNLSVLNYSIPIKAKMPLSELRRHLFSIPEHPGWIPYRTSYYREEWGFCVSHNQMRKMADVEYEVVIDSVLENGHLTYAEYLVPGETSEEVLISSHICHPSLCNDNLSGIALSVFLARLAGKERRRYSYRFLYIPGTIGSIAWLSRNEEHLDRIKCGLVVANVGDAGRFTYKRSRRGDTELDGTVEHVLRHSGQDFTVVPFSPYGYDERQYCSPGINLEVGCLMRTPHGMYPEYHTSADNLEFIHPQSLERSFELYSEVIRVLEGNRVYENLNMKCEPQLGKRGLYAGGPDHKIRELAILWTLNLSDGTHSLLDIAEKSGLEFYSIRNAADVLLENGLLKEYGSGPR